MSVSTIYSTDTPFVHPLAISITPSGSTLLIADRGAHAIFSFDIATRNISSLCGQRGVMGYFTGSCSAVKMRRPSSIRLSGDGSKALVAASGNHAILEINLMTMCARTIAGTSSAGYVNGRAENARFHSPSDAVYLGESMIVVDQGNGVLRRVYEISNDSGGEKTRDGDGDDTILRAEDAFWYVFAFLALAISLIIVGGVLYLRSERRNKNARNSGEAPTEAYAEPVNAASAPPPASREINLIMKDPPGAESI